MQFFNDLFHWAAANRAPLLQFLALLVAFFVALGALCGWLANKTSSVKVAAFFSMIAAGSGDVVKFLDSFSIFIGRIPPMLGKKKRVMNAKGPFDDGGDLPTVELRVMGAFIFAAFFICSLGLIVLGSGGCNPAQVGDAIQTGGDVISEVQCVNAYVDRTSDPTFEGAVLACPAVSMTLAQQIVQDGLDAHKAPASDSGALKLEAPTQFQAQLAKVHHANGGAN